MKKLGLALATVIALGMSTQAFAIGCISGAVAGGVAGHYAGHHAVIGAVGGCVAGHALHKKQVQAKKLQQQQQQAAPATAHPAPAQ